MGKLFYIRERLRPTYEGFPERARSIYYTTGDGDVVNYFYDSYIDLYYCRMKKLKVKRTL